ncbi:hypothetical protein EVAR_66532_1 [Eumeta japonica]|uniref:Uncharacterized protein n=1 Tax=Eumeta variegata TaxID=151549 RepID=A0A4C1ZDV3_EUMVA|nr:hypothetical protein EVAR_66532_1 [Eumeta japonica]
MKIMKTAKARPSLMHETSCDSRGVTRKSSGRCNRTCNSSPPALGRCLGRWIRISQFDPRRVTNSSLTSLVEIGHGTGDCENEALDRCAAAVLSQQLRRREKNLNIHSLDI